MLSVSKHLPKQVLYYIEYQISDENLLHILGYIIGIDELRILLICISYSELIMKQFFLAIILLISHVISGRILKLFDTDKYRISLYFIKSYPNLYTL